jgi:two-component system, NarL family, response regulator NreC
MKSELPTNQRFPGRKARILVVDDHPFFREGIVQFINRQEDVTCCGEADCPSTLYKGISTLQPDMVLLDLRLGHGDGLDLIKAIKAQYPELPILVISQHDETVYAERTLRAGAIGYVMKQEATSEVMTAIRSALDGDLYVSRRLSGLMLRRVFQPVVSSSPVGHNRLSRRESEVLRLVGTGLTTHEIAAQLSISKKTVETYRERLKFKLGLDGVAELIRYATTQQHLDAVAS